MDKSNVKAKVQGGTWIAKGVGERSERHNISGRKRSGEW